MMGRQKEKEVAKDKTVRKHHCPNWHEYEQTPGDGEEWGEPVCCSPRGSQTVRHDLGTERQQQMMGSIYSNQYCFPKVDPTTG